MLPQDVERPAASGEAAGERTADLSAKMSGMSGETFQPWFVDLRLSGARSRDRQFLTGWGLQIP
jgi:hypothetical protein